MYKQKLNLPQGGRGFAPIIIILIIAGIVAAGYFYWKNKISGPAISPIVNTSTSTATIHSNSSSTIDASTWRTYHNDEYGFEVEYPNVYSPKVDNDEIGLLIIRFRNAQDISYYVIHITGKIKFPKLSNFLSNPECYNQIEAEKQNNIDWSINRWKCGIGAEQNPIAAYATKQNYIFEIQLDSNSETSSIERINQILATFKFTN